MKVGHRWRDFRTRAGRRPVKEFIDGLSDEDAAEVAAAMAEVRYEGLSAARHLRGEIYEEGFAKKTRKTPDKLLTLAERRLADWRSRTRSQG